MATNDRNDIVVDGTDADDTDPRNTDHPTGSGQAVENAATENPS